MTIPSLQYLPPWSIQYPYDINPSQTRTAQRGFKRQASRGHRRTMIAQATRVLRLAELPYFEYFIREVCNDGALKFNDVYADGNGLNTGNIRLTGGYSVSSDTRRHVVTCEIEVFR